jgi:quinolinate synthase
LIDLKVRNPDAKVIAHPECEDSILRHADFIGSTSALIEFAKKTDARKFIVATEAGILHRMTRETPGKELIPAPGMDESCACNTCPHMRRNTMEKLYLCLRDLQPRVELDEELRVRALAPIERMLALS